MSGRRALISKDDLDRMASACAAHGVRLRGRVDAGGNFDFTMTPFVGQATSSNDDFEDRVGDFS